MPVCGPEFRVVIQRSQYSDFYFKAVFSEQLPQLSLVYSRYSVTCILRLLHFTFRFPGLFNLRTSSTLSPELLDLQTQRRIVLYSSA